MRGTGGGDRILSWEVTNVFNGRAIRVDVVLAS